MGEIKELLNWWEEREHGTGFRWLSREEAGNISFGS
jgi:hypothetical protein